MSKANEAQMAATQQAETPEVKVPFNPFSVLTLEETTELLGKFPKAWRDAHTVELSNAQTEHGIDDASAIFLVWLRSEAESRINAKKVADASKAIIPLVASVGGTQSKMALELISNLYNNLPVALRPECGIKVRDAVVKSMVGAIAEAKLKLIYAELNVSEKAWMRR